MSDHNLAIVVIERPLETVEKETDAFAVRQAASHLLSRKSALEFCFQIKA